jgi:tetratricopeptide (TPR) repeat protein
MTDPRQRAQELIDEGHQLQADAAEAGLYEKPEELRAVYRRAIEKFSAAIALDPEAGEAYASRSIAAYFWGDSVTAKADVERVLQLPAVAEDDYLVLANPYRGEEKRRLLRLFLTKVAPTSYVHFHLRLSLARSYFSDRSHQAALQELTQLIADLERPEHSEDHGLLPTLYLMQSMAFEALADYTSSITALQRRLELPSTPEQQQDAWCSLFRSFLRAGRTEEARAALQLEDRFTPRDLHLSRTLLSALDDRVTATSAELCALAEDEENSLAGYEKFCAGAALWKLGERALAEPYLRDFISRCRDNPREWGVTMRWEIATAEALLA